MREDLLLRPAGWRRTPHAKRAWHGSRRLLLFARGLVGLMLCGVGALVAEPASAADWPQILGPQRNGIAVGEQLSADRLRKPALLWQAKVGSGFAGVVADEQRAILFHRVKDEERLTAFATETGRILWERGFPSQFQPAIVDDDGPRATPVITESAIIALGAEGRLICVERDTGAVRWQRDTHREFGAPSGYFGAGSSPLVTEDRVIVNVGGPKGAGVVAFGLKDGKTLWQATNDLASYSSPILTRWSGQPQAIVITRLHCLGLDPATGAEQFRIPFGARGPTVNAALPVVVGPELWLTASYGIGAKGLVVADGRVQLGWEDESLSSQYTTPIVAGDVVYGIDGRQDGGPVSLKCLEAKTRRVHWEKSGLPYATLVATADRLLVMQTDGQLRVVELNPDAYREQGLVRLLSGTTRALPALAHGRWYVRNESTLGCFGLSAGAAVK